jgi:hypothetical protein
MFDVYCPGHQARILLGSRSIDALVHGDDGIDLHWTCRCGTRGVLRTGRPRRTPVVDQLIHPAA